MINIKTESHGVSPTFAPIPIDTPRIAFVEPVRGRQPFPVREGGLLTISASDLSLEAVRGDWLNRLLSNGEPFCSWAKTHALKRSIGQGEYPNCPLSLTDAKVILAFFEEIRLAGCNQLTISCEYGKSRSVTTAQLLDAYQNGKVLPAPAEAKNGHFIMMLTLAIQESAMQTNTFKKT